MRKGFRANPSSHHRGLRPSVLIPLIERINKTSASYRDIDVPNYPSYIGEIVKMYCDIEGIVSSIKPDYGEEDYQVGPTDTLITKIMLGVFSNIPAFDQYFEESLKNWIHGEGCKMPSRPKKPKNSSSI